MEQLTFNTEKTLRQPEEGHPEEKLTLILGDCLAALKKISSLSVDLIAIDPPYEIGYNNLDWDAKNNLDWGALATAFARVLKPVGALVIFQGWSEVLNTKKHLDTFFHLNNWIIYDRIKGRGTKKNLVSTREDLLWYVKDQQRYTYNKHPSTIRKVTGGSIGKKNGCSYRAMSNVWTDISPIVPWSKERVAHPTQKPLQLMERIVKLFSNEGDLVLDCFMGSGTTLAACQKLNRSGIGIEVNPAFYRLAQKRIKNGT